MRRRRTTSIRVTIATRDELRALADWDGTTLDQATRQLVRVERQRQMGRELAAATVEDQDQAWLEVSAVYAELRADPVAWAEIESERRQWDPTLGDGLDGTDIDR